jgi:LysM repeat protein
VQTIVDAVNQQRAYAGLAPLQVHPLLNQAAQSHVDDMIATGFYGHMGSDGSYAAQRVQRTGYSGGLASENWVAAGSPESAMDWWMNDWIHRENILNAHWQEIGVGVAGDGDSMVFVTVFTAGSDGSSPAMMQATAPAPEVVAIPTEGLDYEIIPGDTLLAIAYRYGLDWTVIARANDLHEDTLLQIGDHLRLPGVEGIGGAQESAEEAEPIEGAASLDVEVATDNQTETGLTRLYTVQPGNTLVEIAALYDITWEELAAANGLDEDSFLSIGQQLQIPGAIEQAAVPVGEVDINTGSGTATDSTLSVTPQYHTVIEGDTIISIAVKYGMDWDELMALNGIDDDTILSLGQTLIIQ